MPIERVRRFLETEDLGLTHSLGIESNILNDCVNEIKRRDIRGVFGSSCFGFQEENLDFLYKTPDLEQVWFWEINIKDIEGLYELKKLRYFGIQDKRAAIDFSQFKDLESVVWTPRPKDRGLESLLNLRQLDIWRFKNKDKSYEALQLSESLEKLDINWSNPTSLEGFPHLPNLRELQIHYCRNLISIDGIGDIAPNLERLIITRCPNLVDYNSSKELELDHLYINIKGKQMG